ncbi:MAG: hypothetical protein WAX77_13530 [Methylococcaceae bacterium]
MNSKQDIDSLLQKIAELYDATHDDTDKVLYSKIALLELCGWLEMTLDRIVLEYAEPKLTESSNVKYLKEKVKSIYSFEYAKFRDMLIGVIGIIRVESLEKLFEIQKLRTDLGELKKKRDDFAHTTIVVGAMLSIDAPSITINRLRILYPILEKLEEELNKI